MKKSIILWADDDPDDIALMRDVLQTMDSEHAITEVDNGRKALDYLEEARQQDKLPCLIILDMNMPVLSGRETLTLLKADPDFKDIPVVVFTTSNSSLDKMFCHRYGSEMITKPITFNALTDIIQRLLSLCSKPENVPA